MRTTCLALAMMVIAGAVFAVSPASESYLLSVGLGQGACVQVPAGGQVCSQWRTDIWVFNPSTSEAAEVSIFFLERDRANTTPDVRTVTVSAGETRQLADILGTTFGYAKKFGSLRFVADIPVAVTGRIFDANVVGNTGEAGTAGQFFAGLPAWLAVGSGQESSIIGLAQDSTWRSNLFLVEVTGNSATVEVTRIDGSGVVQASASYEVKAREVKQLNKVIETLGAISAANQRIRVSVTAGAGRILTGGAIVDGRTADPTSIEMIAAGTGLGELAVTLPGGVPLVLVAIPGGSFEMGSPESERARDSDEAQHHVTITEGFYLGKYEVTQRQWQAVMGSNPSSFTACGLDCPVEQVSWTDICGETTGTACTSSSFVGKLNELLGTTRFRLPTEAEWEYAARAGTATRFSYGDVLGCDDLCGSCDAHEEQMWWCGNADATTHQVGQKRPNPWGLFDMHGNVWEMVADWYGGFAASAAVDPKGPSSGTYRVKRGGDWLNQAQYCRSARRSSTHPTESRYRNGFRLASSR